MAGIIMTVNMTVTKNKIHAPSLSYRSLPLLNNDLNLNYILNIDHAITVGMPKKVFS